MPSIFDFLFKNRYRLKDTWEPSLDSELNLAVESFYADEAFHRAFGEGEIIDKKAIMWSFIGLVMNRRSNKGKHLVTVRKSKEMKALISGALTCGSTILDELNSPSNKQVPPSISIVENTGYNVQEHENIVANYEAVESKQLSYRFAQYNKLLSEYRENDPAAPWHFSIHMIAVALDEQNQGHLRAMLEKLTNKIQAFPIGEYIQVSTYDQSKAELYEHLGFKLAAELKSNDMNAWVLKMPLSTSPSLSKKKRYHSNPKAALR